MKKKNNKNNPFKIEYKDDQLVISIGIKTLADMGCYKLSEEIGWNQVINDYNEFKVTKYKKFAEEIIYELEKEEENGDTIVYKMLDEVIMNVYENSESITEIIKGK